MATILWTAGQAFLIPNGGRGLEVIHFGHAEAV